MEGAGVLHTDHSGPADGSRILGTAAVPLKRVATNPFFNAQEQPTRWTLLPNATKNSFADSHSIAVPASLRPAGNDGALPSLIVALETSPMEVEGAFASLCNCLFIPGVLTK